MTRRSKKLTPAEKQRRQAQRRERDRLEAITGITEQLTCLDALAAQVADDCKIHVEDLEFDLAGGHHKHRVPGFARREDHLARREVQRLGLFSETASAPRHSAGLPSESVCAGAARFAP